MRLFRILFNSGLGRKFISGVILGVLMVMGVLGALLITHEKDSFTAIRGIFREAARKESESTKETLSALGGKDINNLLAALQDKGRALARLMVTIGTNPLLSNDVKTLERYVQAVSKDKDIAYALYLDSGGKVLTQSSPEPTDKKDLMNITLPVESNGRRIGAVRIGLSKEMAKQQMRYLEDTVRTTIAMEKEEMDDTIRVAETLSLKKTERGVILVLSIIIISIFILTLVISLVFTRTILRPVEELDKAAEKVTLGDLDYRIKTGVVPRCREIGCGGKGCEKEECPAYEREDIPCWYIAGTMCHGKIQGSYAEKIGDCQRCDIYKKYAGDELQHLSNSFNIMTVSLKDARSNLEEKIKIATSDLRDEIAERKEAEEKLGKKAEELEAINKELEAFTYSASHDLKEPLRGIQTFANFILEDYWDKLDDDGRGYLKRITAATTRMKNLIDDLLALSRITKTKRPYESVNAGELAKEAAKRLEAFLFERGVQLKISQDLPIIYGDKVKLTEVFYNLILNGIKYNKQEKPVIEIDSPLRQPEKEVVIYVKDNGIGIKEEYFDKIFEIFRRLHQQDEYGGGTGAGLAIVKRVMDEHKGEIRVESKVGGGTTFILSFPKRRKSEQT